MRLFLVRHGETVDNVAGIYAGVRDSALTIHGVLQAERLARYLIHERGLTFTHFFASDLQRARKTAAQVLSTQVESGICKHKQEDRKDDLHVQEIISLREQDFGFYEGKAFVEMPRSRDMSGKEHHRLQHVNEPGFQDVESKESMDARSNVFLEQHLLPVIFGAEDASKDEPIVIIVAHGIILSHLWRAFLKLIPRRSVSLASELQVPKSGGVMTLEHLGGWSNTGYLELQVDAASTLEDDSRSATILAGYRMHILAVNGRDHLRGLKRTRNVGSSAHDEKQQRMESFFKKTRV